MTVKSFVPLKSMIEFSDSNITVSPTNLQREQRNESTSKPGKKKQKHVEIFQSHFYPTEQQIGRHVCRSVCWQPPADENEWCFISTGSLSGLIEPLSSDPLLAPHVNICHSLQAEGHRFPSFGKQAYYYHLFFPSRIEGNVLWLDGSVNQDGFILM